MKPKEKNMITDWLKENGNPKVEIQVLNEVVDKLVEERDTLLKQRDDYAIEFAQWINHVSYRSFDNNWYLTQIDEDIKKTTEEMLEIFKKEKGL